MFIFVIVIHIITALFLITIILMQSGRGGGLTEAFSGAESIFGTKTNSFMVRTTSVLAAIFLFTCIGLAILSTQRNRSLMESELRSPQKAASVIPQPITASTKDAVESEVNKAVKQAAQTKENAIVPTKEPQKTQ